MEGSIAKQVSFGRSCDRCKVYFVTTDANLYTCPWCLKSGAAGGFETPLDSPGLVKKQRPFEKVSIVPRLSRSVSPKDDDGVSEFGRNRDISESS